MYYARMSSSNSKVVQEFLPAIRAGFVILPTIKQSNQINNPNEPLENTVKDSNQE